MKKIILCLSIIAFTLNVNAQEKAKIRVGLDAGYAIPSHGGGFAGGLDVRYNIMDNINVGVKLNGDFMIKDSYVDEVNFTGSITASVLSSTLITSDYYFNKGDNAFALFVGGGIGLYNVLNIGAQVNANEIPTIPTNFDDYKSENKFGGLIRTGFEAGHFRLGLEYYLIPKSTLYNVLNTTTSITKNSFLNISLGFYLGGGKWKK